MSRRRAALAYAAFTLITALMTHAVDAAPAGPAGVAAGDHAFAVSPDFTELQQLGEHGRTYRMLLIIVQIEVLLAAAKLLGWAAERIRVPGVIGELLAGVIIGPFSSDPS